MAGQTGHSHCPKTLLQVIQDCHRTVLGIRKTAEGHHYKSVKLPLDIAASAWATAVQHQWGSCLMPHDNSISTVQSILIRFSTAWNSTSFERRADPIPIVTSCVLSWVLHVLLFDAACLGFGFAPISTLSCHCRSIPNCIHLSCISFCLVCFRYVHILYTHSIYIHHPLCASLFLS